MQAIKIILKLRQFLEVLSVSNYETLTFNLSMILTCSLDETL